MFASKYCFHHLLTSVQDVYPKCSTHLEFDVVFIPIVQMCVCLIFVSAQNWQCVLKRYPSHPDVHMDRSMCQLIVCVCTLMCGCSLITL